MPSTKQGKCSLTTYKMYSTVLRALDKNTLSRCSRFIRYTLPKQKYPRLLAARKFLAITLKIVSQFLRGTEIGKY